MGLAKDGGVGEVGEFGAKSVRSGTGEVTAAVKGDVGDGGFEGGPTMAKKRKTAEERRAGAAKVQPIHRW